MTSTLLVFQFILTVVLTITVLLQKSSSIGLGAYSGSNESVFGAKGPAGFLTKFTFFIGGLFLINTIALGYLYNINSKESIAEKIVVTENNTTSAPQAPNAKTEEKVDIQTPITPKNDKKPLTEIQNPKIVEAEVVKNEINSTVKEVEINSTIKQVETNSTIKEVEINSTAKEIETKADENQTN